MSSFCGDTPRPRTSRRWPVALTRTGHPRAGFALLTVLLILVAVVALTGVMYALTITTQRRVQAVASGTHARYAAEAGLKALQFAVQTYGQRGWLTSQDLTALPDLLVVPEIAGIQFDTLAVTLDSTTVELTPLTATRSPVQGLRVWRQYATLRASARDTLARARVSLTQTVQFDLMPFAQAAVTVMGETELVDGTRARLRLNGVPDQQVPSLRVFGPLWIAPDSGAASAWMAPTYGVELFGSVAVQGSLFRARKDSTRFITQSRVAMFTGSAWQEIPAPALPVAGMPNSVDSTWLRSTFASPGYQWVTGGTPPSMRTAYPNCTELTPDGILGLGCRGQMVTAGVMTGGESALDVAALPPTAGGPTGILYLQPAASASRAFIRLRNTSRLPRPLTFVSEQPLLLEGAFNTTIKQPAALIAPRVFLDTLPVPGGTPYTTTSSPVAYAINALLVSWYTPSGMEGTAPPCDAPSTNPSGTRTSYCGGVTASIPTLVSSQYWWDGNRVEITGGVLAFAQSGSYWTGGTYREPTRIVGFDPDYLVSPDHWPPGMPGRYSMAMGPIRTIAQ